MKNTQKKKSKALSFQLSTEHIQETNTGSLQWYFNLNIALKDRTHLLMPRQVVLFCQKKKRKASYVVKYDAQKRKHDTSHFILFCIFFSRVNFNDS